jgi:hypothetical protein
VKAFMPGRSGRLVAGDGFPRGLDEGTFLRAVMLLKGLRGLKSAASCDEGEMGELRSELLDLCEALLFLRAILRIEPKKDLDGAASSVGLIPQADPGVGMMVMG